MYEKTVKGGAKSPGMSKEYSPGRKVEKVSSVEAYAKPMGDRLPTTKKRVDERRSAEK